MAKIKINKGFNYREGGEVKHYNAGKEEQEVSDACAAHAIKIGAATGLGAEPKPGAKQPIAAAE